MLFGRISGVAVCMHPTWRRSGWCRPRDGASCVRNGACLNPQEFAGASVRLKMSVVEVSVRRDAAVRFVK